MKGLFLGEAMNKIVLILSLLITPVLTFSETDIAVEVGENPAVIHDMAQDSKHNTQAGNMVHGEGSVDESHPAPDGGEHIGEGEEAHGDSHGEHHVHLDGAHVSLLWCIPFLGILLSIAIFPLVAGHIWHHHYGKISLFWWLAFIIPFVAVNGVDMGLFYLLEVYLGEFIPFIILLFALFTIAGGVRLKGSLRGSPMVNTMLLLIGTVLASWMGTTGAAMLLIRPLIRANSWRKHQVHTIVFFIFLVANIGGSLSPLR